MVRIRESHGTRDSQVSNPDSLQAASARTYPIKNGPLLRRHDSAHLLLEVGHQTQTESLGPYPLQGCREALVGWDATPLHVALPPVVGSMVDHVVLMGVGPDYEVEFGSRPSLPPFP